MKLNNKGYMLSEIIVCSIITFAIAFFLVDIAINFKKKAEISYLNSKYMVNYTLINKNIMDDVENYNLKKVEFKKNNNTYYIDFSYLVNEDIVLKRLTLQNGDNVINYKYGVYDSNYIKNDYYVEKKLDNMGVTDINLVNKCYGDTISKNNVCIKNNNYQGVKLKYNGLLNIYIKTDNTFIDNKEMVIVIPYNNYETVIIPNEEEL